MELDHELMQKILETFNNELEERLQDITDGLLKLETGGLTLTDKAKTIETIFRAAHNIKGAARSVGVRDTGEVAHYLESLFSAIQSETFPLSSGIIDLSLEAVDSMRSAMVSFTQNSPLTFDLANLLSRLQTGEARQETKEEVLPTTVMEPIEDSNKADKIHNTDQVAKIRKRKKFAKDRLSKTQPSIKTFDDSQSAVPHTMKPKKILPVSLTNEEDFITPAVLETSSPVSEQKEHDTIRVSIDSLDRVSALMEEIQVNKIAIDDHYSDLTKLNARTKHLDHLWKQVGFAVHSKSTGETLEKLYNASTDYLSETSNTIHQLHKNMHSRINDLDILSNSLQDEVRMLRLIPAAVLLRVLPRTARDISHALHKKVELNITGDSVKMDKMVLEGLQDPIMHLLRNSIDHGIESSEIRLAAGKPEMGHIGIDIHEEGDQILISISDDGGGIDVQQIANIAQNKKIITKADLNNMTEAEILDLIFFPGFSTKKIITDVSGRGVGLDVVKSNITNLKGQVSVSTVVGQGTTFNLRVPLTLASERGLLLRSGGQLFVMPTNLIDRVLFLQTNEIIEVEASQAIILNKHPVPLLILTDILGLTKKEQVNRDRMPIIVLRKGLHSVALLVEEIIGEREIVVKPLQAPLVHVECVAGGTLSGNGQVIVVLNANDLINKSLHIEKASWVNVAADTTLIEARPHILVVDDSITTRTLEKNILETKNYQVTTAVNGKEAWDLLQNQKFALLITDVTMPIMDGFSLTEHVKQGTATHDLPVIIVTSLDSDSEKKRGIEVGADAYIVKNAFESEQLLEIVKQLV